MLFGQTSQQVEIYITRYKSLALHHEKEYGVPAPITLAQGILESAAGTSTLAKNANNHFGIKANSDWNGRVFESWDDELQKSVFRVYSTAEESFKDHSLFLKNNGRYRKCFALSVFDYRSWAINLQKCGYATASNYAKNLISIIDENKLYEINNGVRLIPGKTAVIKTETINVNDDEVLDNLEQEDYEDDPSDCLEYYMNGQINGVKCVIFEEDETLGTLASKYGIEKKKLLKLNETSSEKLLKKGCVVFLDKKKDKYGGNKNCYIANGDELLYDVSQKFGIKIEKLAKMNGKDTSARLKNGEKIRLK